MIRNELHYQFTAEKDVLDIDGLKGICGTINLDPEVLLERYRAHALSIYDITRSVKRRHRSDIDRSHGNEWAERLEQAENPDTPLPDQFDLARSQDRVMRLAIAWSSNCEQVLRTVMESEIKNKREGMGYDWNILFALAHNPDSPNDVCNWLRGFKDHGNPYRKIFSEVERRMEK